MEVNLRNAELRISTPLGLDRFWLRINDDNSGVFDSGLDKYPFTADSHRVNDGRVTIDVEISAPVRESISMEFDSTCSNGIIKVGNYPPLKFEVYGGLQ